MRGDAPKHKGLGGRVLHGPSEGCGVVGVGCRVDPVLAACALLLLMV